MEMFIIEARKVFLADDTYVLPVYLVFRLLSLLPGYQIPHFKKNMENIACF